MHYKRRTEIFVAGSKPFAFMSRLSISPKGAITTTCITFMTMTHQCNKLLISSTLPHVIYIGVGGDRGHPTVQIARDHLMQGLSITLLSNCPCWAPSKTVSAPQFLNNTSIMITFVCSLYLMFTNPLHIL